MRLPTQVVFLTCKERSQHGFYTKDFGEYLTDIGKADNAVNSYTGDVKGFIQFLSARDITFEGNLNRFTIISYKNHLLEKAYEPTTINKKLNSIQSFNEFLISKEYMSESVINLDCQHFIGLFF